VIPVCEVVETRQLSWNDMSLSPPRFSCLETIESYSGLENQAGNLMTRRTGVCL